jgi:DNA-binding response OmpR family regulator
MGANLKALIPRTTGSSTEPTVLPTFFVDSSTPICIAELQEVRRMSQFLPIIVLVPKAIIQDQNSANKIAANSKSDTTNLERFELFDKAAEPFRQLGSESESVFGDVIVNFSEMTVCRKGMQVTVTSLEFKILKYLIQNARRAISRDELLNEVWGYENYPCTRTVDNHILRLRHKLEREPSRPVHFLTIHGTGYKFLP